MVRVGAGRSTAAVVVALAGFAAGALGGASPAGAGHVPGALYTGTHSGRGGAIEFQVSPDWRTITRVKFSAVPIPISTFSTCLVTFEPTSLAAGIPIADHAFSFQAKEGTVTVTFSGSFATPQQASGSFELDLGNVIRCGNVFAVTSGSFRSGTLTWTAATTTPPPAPAPVTLAGPTTQKAGSGKVVLLASCPMPCELTAKGSVSVPVVAGGRRTVSGANRVFPLGPATASLDNPGEAQLVLSVPSRARKAIKQALARRKRVVATVTVAAVYDSGTVSATRRVTLKR